MKLNKGDIVSWKFGEHYEKSVIFIVLSPHTVCPDGREDQSEFQAFILKEDHAAFSECAPLNGETRCIDYTIFHRAFKNQQLEKLFDIQELQNEN